MAVDDGIRAGTRRANAAPLAGVVRQPSKAARDAQNGKQVSEALGRVPQSLNLDERHPFDVEIARLPPGTTPFPYHSHSAQWELYHVISGTGVVRHDGGTTPIEPGDAFIFKPGEAHVVSNDSAQDLVLYVVADNPVGESAYFPDSKKWTVHSPERTYVRRATTDYYDGVE
jgi:uncharacterized cupin superfamily protein